MCDRHANPLGQVLRKLLPAPGGSPGQAEPAQPAAAEALRRRKLWNLAEKHHCPVIGTCLNMEDLKKAARKAGYAGQLFNEYRLHVEAVNLSLSRNDAAEVMQKTLERKFALHVKRFDQAKNDAEVRALWKRHLDLGEVAGGMWATLSHRHATEETRQVVYEEVHMLSHQVGAGQAADMRRLGTLEADNRRLLDEARCEAERHRREIAEKLARLHQLERESGEIARRVEAAHPLRARLEALENGSAMISMGRRLLVAQAEADRARELAVRNEAMARELERLRRERDDVVAERDALERALFPASEDEPACSGECDRCADRLGGQCILCVGGRITLLPQCRQLAERLGVRLIHHDGGREEALSRLPALLASSDAVICPTDCVGHLAYYQLKQHCKQAGKPCVLLNSSGVASFAAALTRLAEGRVEIHSQART